MGEYEYIEYDGFLIIFVVPPIAYVWIDSVLVVLSILMVVAQLEWVSGCDLCSCSHKLIG